MGCCYVVCFLEFKEVFQFVCVLKLGGIRVMMVTLLVWDFWIDGELYDCIASSFGVFDLICAKIVSIFIGVVADFWWLIWSNCAKIAILVLFCFLFCVWVCLCVGVGGKKIGVMNDLLYWFDVVADCGLLNGNMMSLILTKACSFGLFCKKGWVFGWCWWLIVDEIIEMGRLLFSVYIFYLRTICETIEFSLVCWWLEMGWLAE